MARTVISNHLSGLIEYLSHSEEKANEDLPLTYFRSQFPNFTRQAEAKGADGYVAGHFVLELKSKKNDWYAGLIQGLSYKRELDFSAIVVIAKGFLAIWRVEDIPEDLQSAVLMKESAPNKVGKELSLKFKHLKNQIYKKTIWQDVQIDDLLKSDQQTLLSKIKSFDETLKKCQKVRQKITPNNFTKILKQMIEYFDSSQPIKVVRAFYSMIYGWDEGSILSLSNRDQTQATLAGEIIKHLIPDKRIKFKNFVENYYVCLSENESRDDFFAQYDKALDTVDKKFRIQHGIFFTDLDLSKFAMWFVKQYIPNLGRDYIVIDPACGSGNLVTNWRAPLQLRHKIVSEIEPELLFAVEKRMQDPKLNDEKFTVVPKTNKGIGLNFLDKSAEDYIHIINEELKEKGLRFNKPLAFLCNPPYRGDDDKAADQPGYTIHSSIIELISEGAKAERYSCFLAQMKLICDKAVESGLPSDSRLLLFTKSAWLTSRPSFELLRNEIFNSFQFLDGVLVRSKEFFDVKGNFPIAFTIWSYKKNPKTVKGDVPPVFLRDLCWVTKRNLKIIPWDDQSSLDQACSKLVNDSQSKKVPFGFNRNLMKGWVGIKRHDFIRSRRKDEVKDKICGGLPEGDRRLINTSAYGESKGLSIGFMDDMTPCRVNNDKNDVPWFRLNSQFMDCKRNRCFSGPPDNRGYCATSHDVTIRAFLWFALARTFVQIGYPLYADAEELWVPEIPSSLNKEVIKYTFSIGFAENECVETRFPANNPIKGIPEIYSHNPMAPNNPTSFWVKVMAPYFSKNGESLSDKLVQAVNVLYHEWEKRFKNHPEIYVSYKRPYFITQGVLKATAGLVQIKDYANENNDQSLIDLYKKVQQLLKEAKQEFYNLLVDPKGINYFGSSNEVDLKVKSQKETEYDIKEKKLVLASIVVNLLSESKGFGRIKFAKVFYIADMMSKQNLGTQYYREVAGPIDYNFLYDKKTGVEILASQNGYFFAKTVGPKIHYRIGNNISIAEKKASDVFRGELPRLKEIIGLFERLSTEQSEIVATLFACWNDLLIDRVKITDQSIIDEVRNNWHLSKKRFTDRRLQVALLWMREKSIIPMGKKLHTLQRKKLKQVSHE